MNALVVIVRCVPTVLLQTLWPWLWKHRIVTSLAGWILLFWKKKKSGGVDYCSFDSLRVSVKRLQRWESAVQSGCCWTLLVLVMRQTNDHLHSPRCLAIYLDSIYPPQPWVLFTRSGSAVLSVLTATGSEASSHKWVASGLWLTKESRGDWIGTSM